MKIATAMLLLSATVFAQEAGKVTPELAALKKRYQQDVEIATKPVRDRYVSSLQSLLRSVTARGDAASIVAIQAELTADTNVTALIGLWSYHGPGGPSVREFRANHTFALKQSGPTEGKWDISGEKLKLTYREGTDVFSLPITPGKMVGRSSASVDVTMSNV